MANYITRSFVDIFKEIDPSALEIENKLKVPDDFYQQLLDYVLERGYINEVGKRNSFLNFAGQPGEPIRRITWLQVMRLPIHPNEMKEYDLLSRWQGVLATLHTWGHRLIFLLQRKGGETRLYLGTSSFSQDISPNQAIGQFREATSGSMPGIDLEPLSDDDAQQKITGTLLEYKLVGAVTGIPSFKKDAEFGMLQTLDQLAFGIRDSRGDESDFSLMVIADPLDDTVTSETISKFRRLGSEIHTNVKRSLSASENNSKGKDRKVGIGSAIGGLVGTAVGLAAAAIPAVGPALAPFILHATSSIGGAVGGTADMGSSDAKSVGQSVSAEYLDKFAEYAEQVTEMHCERLNRGRNLGFWNTGIYVLGKSRKDINTVMGILRSIYSGDVSFIEPIRANILNERSGAIDIVRSGELIPLANENAKMSDAVGEWNIFGKAYQYLSTPMNTEELSLATSLPRRDVPGLRFVKSSVRFANNPSLTGKDTICLGHMVDTGVVQKNEYRIDPDALVRHAVVAGSTGSGKSTTCKTIISEVLDIDIPVMIVEPAKDDYVRWAIDYNRKLYNNPKLSEEEKDRRSFQIFMPGLDTFEGVKLEKLELNPFQPAGMPGKPLDLLTRVEHFIAIVNASLPNDEILPILFDQLFYEYINHVVGPEFLEGEIEPLDKYPDLSGLGPGVDELMDRKNYPSDVQRSLREAMKTRLMYLVRGKRGRILDAPKSVDFDRLFTRPAIINLSKIADTKDKALIMSILMLALYEYRISCYTHDTKYRKMAQDNKLLHLTVIEEAHNLLMKPSVDFGKTGNAQQVVADLFTNMLSEIRGYGQGLVIVDQIPTRLVPDVLKNTNYKIVHRLTAPDDCEIMAGGLALREDQQKIIPALGIGDAIICGDMDDAAAWVRISKR